VEIGKSPVVAADRLDPGGGTYPERIDVILALDRSYGASAG
jgi:hypothetical protein